MRPEEWHALLQWFTSENSVTISVMTDLEDNSTTINTVPGKFMDPWHVHVVTIAINNYLQKFVKSVAVVGSLLKMIWNQPPLFMCIISRIQIMKRRCDIIIIRIV